MRLLIENVGLRTKGNVLFNFEEYLALNEEKKLAQCAGSLLFCQSGL